MSKRPLFNESISALLTFVEREIQEFQHIDARRILVLAGEARRASRATVKPLAFDGGVREDELGRRKPLVKINGRRILYTVTLRPLFFRNSTPRERVATLVHELFHISTQFDGTLDEHHRHAEMGRTFERAFRPLEKKVWKKLPASLRAAFAYHGEVRILQWLERPSAWNDGEKNSMRRVYTEEHLFEGIVRMKTRGERGELALDLKVR